MPFSPFPSRPAPRLRGGTLGILLTLASCLLFAAGNAVSKSVLQSVPMFEVLCLRAVLTVLLLAPLIHRSDLKRARAAGSLWLHGLRVGCSSCEVCCYYTGVTLLPLADVSAIYLASSIYVTAMSAVFLHEAVDWRHWVAVGVGFVGVLVALSPGAGFGAYGPSALIVVLGSVIYAISLVATRRLRGAPNFVLVISQTAGLAVITAISLPDWEPLGVWDAGMVALAGLFSLAGYLTMNRGLQVAMASVVAPFNYSAIVWAAMFGFMAFGEVPGASVLLGAVIIIGAGLFLALCEQRPPRAA